MALGPRLDLRQSQSLVMTPQLQQAIRLLALSNLEIESFIAEEMERNPLLESGDGGSNEAEREEALATGPAGEAETLDQLVQTGDAERDAPLDIDYDSEDFHQDSAADSMRGLDGGLGLDGGGGSGEAPDLDSFPDEEGVSLQDHLMAQAGATLSSTDLVVAGQIIELLDETGYLTAPLPELAMRLGLPLAEVERVLGLVQRFDPAGIAARSLAECLALQAKEADRYDPAMAR
ncbi:MAG TPA: RNA polymerase sigma-54 factor, partial [Allosphingosinicella sp.]